MDRKRIDLIRNAFYARYGSQPELWVQAPGRVDLLGSHTDYNLGYVLTQAIDRNTMIAAKARNDGCVRVMSLNKDGVDEFDLKDIQHAKKYKWGNYVRGVADMLQHEGYSLKGFDGLIHSTIPFGSGLSSSAALEVAVLELFVAMGELNLKPLQKAQLCQRAENEFVGMNCGIMDQYSSIMGRKGCTLLIDCQSLTSQIKTISPDIQIMVCDTHAQRELTDSEYDLRRAQCEEGVRLLAEKDPNVQSLRDVSTEMLKQHALELDPIVLNRCQFIIDENLRVQAISNALVQGDRLAIKRITDESFSGARDLYQIVSDEMIAMRRAIMDAPGAVGARGAGAGFGGCLVAFIEKDAIEPFSSQVFDVYLAETEIEPEIFPVSAADGSGRMEIARDI